MVARLLGTVVVLALTSFLVSAQEAPKPGPEHERFTAFVGEWDATIKFAGGESKGKSVWKLDFGGFYLVQEFESDFGGLKFKGRGTSGYCPIRKKYISTWIDSMSPSPMVMFGKYVENSFVEEGEAPNMEGKMIKMKTKSTMPDKDTIHFTMYEIKDDKDSEMMSITYKRKK